MHINQQAIKRTITKQAQYIQRLHQQVHKTFANRDNSQADWQAWERACEIFHQNYHTALGFDGGENGLLEQLRRHDAYAIEYAVCFIEVRPYFFRSGYLYQTLLKKLNHVPLSESQRQRYLWVKKRYLAKVWRHPKTPP